MIKSTKLRWTLRIPFIAFFLLCLGAWPMPHTGPWELGHISARGSWNMRCIPGRIDLIRMNRAWPRSQPGWNIRALEPDREMDLNLLSQSDHVAGLALRIGRDWTFLALPCWFLFPAASVSLWFAWRMTCPQKPQPITRLARKTIGRYSPVQCALLLLLLAAICLLALAYCMPPLSKS